MTGDGAGLDVMTLAEVARPTAGEIRARLTRQHKPAWTAVPPSDDRKMSIGDDRKPEGAE